VPSKQQASVPVIYSLSRRAAFGTALAGAALSRYAWRKQVSPPRKMQRQSPHR